MKVITRRFGEIDIKSETVSNFDKGILGFPEMKKYVLLDPNSKSPLKWLQSIDKPELAFVVTDQNIFFSTYEIRVHASELTEIDLNDAAKSIQLVIVTVPNNPSEMTANLRGPLIINTDNMKGKQIILDDSDYEIKYRLLQEEKMAVNS